MCIAPRSYGARISLTIAELLHCGWSDEGGLCGYNVHASSASTVPTVGKILHGLTYEHPRNYGGAGFQKTVQQLMPGQMPGPHHTQMHVRAKNYIFEGPVRLPSWS